MWNVNGNDLKMCEGDYGIALPIKINGMTFASGDCVKITFKDENNGNEILVKDYSSVNNNTVNLEFTQEESALFPVGNYVYRMDAYQNGNYLNNIVPSASLKVVDVA